MCGRYSHMHTGYDCCVHGCLCGSMPPQLCFSRADTHKRVWGQACRHPVESQRGWLQRRQGLGA